MAMRELEEVKRKDFMNLKPSTPKHGDPWTSHCGDSNRSIQMLIPSTWAASTCVVARGHRHHTKLFISIEFEHFVHFRTLYSAPPPFHRTKQTSTKANSRTAQEDYAKSQNSFYVEKMLHQDIRCYRFVASINLYHSSYLIW